MNWTLAIERNRAALLRIVAALVALAGLGPHDATLPRALRNAVLRLLRPAESAVRRLVVIAACGLQVAARSNGVVMRGFAAWRRKPETGSPCFPLLDPPKRFAWLKPRTVPGFGPRISVIGLVEPVFTPTPMSGSDDLVPARPVSRRIAALVHVLDDLPAAARRLALWRARQIAAKSTRTSPLRPGRPPGKRRRAVREVDALLAECHALALDALDGVDTS